MAGSPISQESAQQARLLGRPRRGGRARGRRGRGDQPRHSRGPPGDRAGHVRHRPGARARKPPRCPLRVRRVSPAPRPSRTSRRPERTSRRRAPRRARLQWVSPRLATLVPRPATSRRRPPRRRGAPGGTPRPPRPPGRRQCCGPARRPGTLGDFSDLTYGNLVPDAEQFTAQWQEIQFRFVDDPRGSVTEAADIVAQVTAKMEAAIQERQRAIEERQQRHRRAAALAARPVGRGQQRRHRGAARDAADVQDLPRPAHRLADQLAYAS